MSNAFRSDKVEEGKMVIWNSSATGFRTTLALADSAAGLFRLKADLTCLGV